MLNITADWDTETLDLMQMALDQYPQKADKVLRSKVRPYVSQRVNTTLRKAPPAHPWSSANPPPWTSNKQRGAYFRTKGFGKGIPTQRTNRNISSWHVRADYKKDFGLLVVYSDSETEQFITGIRQQRFHKLAGWPHAPTLIPEILLEAEFVFVDGLLDILWEGIF